MKPVDPFYHPKLPDALPGMPDQRTPQGGSNGVLTNLVAMNVGKGKYGFYVNRQGMYLGDQDFQRAPFSVDMNGQARFRDKFGQTIIDASGVKSDTQFLSSEIEDFTDRQISSITPTVIPFTSLTFEVPSVTNVIVLVTATAYIAGLTGGDAGASPTGNVQLSIDNVPQNFRMKFKDVRMYTPEVSLAISRTLTQSYQKLVQLAQGPHTIELVHFLDAASSYTMHVIQTSVNYITLGK